MHVIYLWVIMTCSSDRKWKICILFVCVLLFFFFLRKFQPMASAYDDSSLFSDQDTNWFFDISEDWIPDLLFNHQRFYQLN